MLVHAFLYNGRIWTGFFLVGSGLTGLDLIVFGDLLSELEFGGLGSAGIVEFITGVVGASETGDGEGFEGFDGADIPLLLGPLVGFSCET